MRWMICVKEWERRSITAVQYTTRRARRFLVQMIEFQESSHESNILCMQTISSIIENGFCK